MFFISLFFISRTGRFIPVFALCVLCFGNVSCHRAPDDQGAASTRVTFIDVGEGDAALIQTADGSEIMIDSGPGNLAAAELERRQIHHLNLLVLSHSHEDHTGGLRFIAAIARIDRIWYSGVDYSVRATARLEAAGPLEAVREGKIETIGGLELKVLHPSQEAPGGKGNHGINDNSIVLRASDGTTSYLFTGDCELSCWESLFRDHRAELASDILKLAHHGSGNGTNSGVLINVRPKAVIISCGRDNKFGHPDPLVLKLVEKWGSALFRTDLAGSIECQDGSCLQDLAGRRSSH